MQPIPDIVGAAVKPSNNMASAPVTVSETSQASQSGPQTVSVPPPQEQLYRTLSQYHFASDSEYQAGLASILGHPETPATPSEITSKQDLVLQAQCFYFSRKFNTPPINPVAYNGWFCSQTSNGLINDKNTETSSSSSSLQSQPHLQQTTPQALIDASTPATEEPPPYPTSFAAIVDLITNNKPIPGIQEIPTTILDLGSSKQDRATRRKKPWETSTTEVDKVTTTTPAPSDIVGNSPAAIASIPTEDDAATTTTTNPETRTTAAPSEPSIEKAKKTGEGVVKILQPNAIPDSGLVAKD